MKPTELLPPEQRLPSMPYLVKELRKAVFPWREEGYPNTTVMNPFISGSAREWLLKS
ncbi:MAG: hypothetical protein ACE5J9_07060 [Methanosarcinales archaeon]